MTLDGTVLAHIETLQGLHAALRDRAEALGWTREVIGEAAGLTSGYAGKLLSPTPQKSLGEVSMPAVLGALGVRLVLVVDPDAKPLLARLPRRQRPPLAGPHWRTARKAAAATTALGAASAALNAARNEKLSPEERRSIASAAARARWDARRR